MKRGYRLGDAIEMYSMMDCVLKDSMKDTVGPTLLPINLLHKIHFTPSCLQALCLFTVTVTNLWLSYDTTNKNADP